MAGEILRYLESLLAEGSFQIGQILVGRDFSLHHIEDQPTGDLRVYSHPQDAVELARYDDSGRYRPLKSAPNLRHGWFLRLASSREVLQALDFLYPSALGTALAVQEGRGAPVNFRTTLARQSGMYTVVRRLTDSQATDLIVKTCHHGCLRQILWSISETTPTPERQENNLPGTLPIYCPEACNLLVAAGRPLAKSNPPQP